MMYLFVFYVSCQLILVGLFALAYSDGNLEANSKNVCMILTTVSLSPLGVLAVIGVIVDAYVQNNKRRKCESIMNRWKATAREGTNWLEWELGGSQDFRNSKLRETIGCLSDKELRLLTSVRRSTHSIEESTRDALVDEIIYREINRT